MFKTSPAKYLATVSLIALMPVTMVWAKDTQTIVIIDKGTQVLGTLPTSGTPAIIGGTGKTIVTETPVVDLGMEDSTVPVEVPEPVQAGDITYLTGGIGEEERNAMQSILPELERLAQTSQEAADALEAARGRLTGLSADYFAFITQVLPAALKRAADAFAEEELKLREDSAAKIGDIEDKRREKEIEAGDKRDEAYISAREKRDEAEAKLAEDLAKRRRDIERRANADLTNAIANRDVLAFTLAKKQRDEDLKSLEEDGEDRRKEIDAQFLNERRIADENYRKALQQARKAADDSIRQEQDRLRREIKERAAAYQAQLNQLQQFNIQGTQAIDSFVPNAVTGLQGLANSVIGIIGGGSGGGGGGGSKFPPLILPPGGQPIDDPGRYSSMRAFSAPTTERAFSQASGGSRGDINISFKVEGVSEEKVMERVRVAYRKATQQLNAGV